MGMALDNKKPLGEQIDWADMAEKLVNGFNHCSDVLANRKPSSWEGEMQAGIAMGQIAQALETIVKRQEATLNAGPRIPSKERTTP